MPEKPAAGTPSDRPSAVYQARIEPGVRCFDAPADLPLLLAAERAGLAVVSSCRNGSCRNGSCRNGTCRSCICRLLSGRVTYRIEWPGLSPDEKQTGRILPCVAYPVSDVVLSQS